MERANGKRETAKGKQGIPNLLAGMEPYKKYKPYKSRHTSVRLIQRALDRQVRRKLRSEMSSRDRLRKLVTVTPTSMLAAYFSD